MAENLPINNPQQRAKAAKEPDTTSQASFNQRDEEVNPGISNVQPSIEDEGRTTRHPDEPGRTRNETAIRQQEELRSERDPGYGSEYIGDEYKDIKVEDHEKDDAA